MKTLLMLMLVPSIVFADSLDNTMRMIQLDEQTEAMKRSNEIAAQQLEATRDIARYQRNNNGGYCRSAADEAEILMRVRKLIASADSCERELAQLKKNK